MWFNLKKIKDILTLIIGILLFLLSYRLDNYVNLFFKSLKFPFLEFILSILTNFGIVIVVMLVIPSIVLYKKNKKLIYSLFLAFTSSFILAFILKLIVLRQRPTEIFTHPNFSIINYPVINILYYSFPSMHAMVVFALLPILIKYLSKQKNFWIVFSLLVAFSRLYFEFHFLSDVVFGALVGYFVGKFLLGYYERKQNK